MIDMLKFPRTKKFLEETHMTLDDALIWTEIEIKKMEENNLIKEARYEKQEQETKGRRA
jgi:hypothetical protein